MTITYIQQQGDFMKKIDSDISPSEWHNKPIWIDIRSDNRDDVLTYFEKNHIYEEMLDYIKFPGNYKSSKRFNESKIINLPISNSKNIYESEYLIIIVEENLILTIIPQSYQTEIETTLSKSPSDFSAMTASLFTNIISNILVQNNINARLARERVHTLEESLIKNPNKLSPIEIVTCESEIGNLADIFEDQYLSFGILASVGNENFNHSSNSKSKEFVEGIGPLIKAMDRLEKKTESLRLQFLLFQQEKSTRKINTLTIIQAIFVPLTFIAGVYGMNFVNIPELNYKYAYYICWGAFLFVAGGLLSYFYKNGWFD